MVFRYQNPVIGKFLSIDPVYLAIGNPTALKLITGKSLSDFLTNPQAINSYTYALNNPLRYIDPTGQYRKDVHLYLTSFLGRVSGLSANQYKTVASYNQAMDDNFSTKPTNPLNVITLRTNKFHFASRLDVAGQMFDLLNGGQGNTQDLLSEFGSLLHTFQDTYSHEGLTPKTHAEKGSEPDYTHLAPDKAMQMSKQSFMMLRRLNMKLNGTGDLTIDQYNTESQQIWSSIEGRVKNYINQSGNKQDVENINSYRG